MKIQLFLSVLAFAGAAQGQQITRIVPQVASPGSTVIVEGSGLSLATDVRLRAFVGGFVGELTKDSPVSSTADTRVTADVPVFNAFIPPGPPGSGSPFGLLRVIKNGGLGPDWQTTDLNFYFLEGTGGVLENAGLGSTQSNGDRAVVSFDPGPPVPPDDPLKGLGSGAPIPGNLNFQIRLEAAVPGSLSALFLGAPGPGLPFGDGVIAIDLSGPFATLIGSVVDPMGNASLALPVPAGVAGAGSFVLQWATIDLGNGKVEISNGLRVNY